MRAKKDVWISDIDGTLADHEGIRSPYDESKVSLDKPIEAVFRVLVSLIRNNQKVIFVSGRTDGCKEDTENWIYDNLQKFGLNNREHYQIVLFMRKIGDRRKDSIVKKEIYDDLITPYFNIIGVFDDRLQVCRMLYENNIFCFNVNQGLREF